MATNPAATLTLDKDSYVHGETITATYDVTGVDEIKTFEFEGVVKVNGVEVGHFGADAKIGDQVEFLPPTSDGLVFSATDNPRVFIATA